MGLLGSFQTMPAGMNMCGAKNVSDVIEIDCKIALAMATNAYLVASEWVQIVFSTANIVLVCLIVRVHRNRKGIFHVNFKVC